MSATAAVAQLLALTEPPGRNIFGSSLFFVFFWPAAERFGTLEELSAKGEREPWLPDKDPAAGHPRDGLRQHPKGASPRVVRFSQGEGEKNRGWLRFYMGERGVVLSCLCSRSFVLPLKPGANLRVHARRAERTARLGCRSLTHARVRACVVFCVLCFVC